MGRIFISHRNTPADNAWAAKVHAWIKDQKGIHGFLDFDVEDGIEAGEEWEKKIYASMNAAQVVIAIVSNDWLASDWCVSEARMARLLGRRLLLVITEDCTVPFRDTQSIRFDKHGDEAIVFEELRQALRTTHKLPERPYPGLATFEEKDAAVFFGRENETRDLVNRVNSLFQGRPKTPRILLVQGASGSGKSSLMRAGFMSEFTTDPKNLCIGPIIPRGDALDELSEVLDTPLDERDPDAAADAVIAALKRANPAYERAVICIDQAEELLEESGAFFDVLRALLEKRRGRVIVLATVRSDFLNEFQTRRLIGEEAALRYATIELDPLPKDHLSAIIREPARLFGVEYDDALFAKICEDHGGPDALPLLAFFLNKFWQDEYVRDGVLQLSEYKDFGGINQALKGAVAEAVESCMAVEPAQKDRQKVLQELGEVFLGHLVAVSPGSDSAVRRRAPAEGLSPRQIALLKVFAAQRLLLEDKEEWEVAHEALLRQWEDLRNWIDAAREDLVAINRIEAASAQWDREGRRDEDLIHSGSRLEDGFRMRNSSRYAERFDATGTAYLEACRRKEDDRFEKERALREEAERERDRAEAQRTEAEAEARRAQKNQRLGLAALSFVELQSRRPSEAVYLGLAAWPRRLEPSINLSDYTMALRAMENAGVCHREVLRITAREKKITCVAFSPDGRLIVSGDSSHKLQLWDAQTGDPVGGPISGHEDFEIGGMIESNIHCVAFSPDGKRIVSGGDDLKFRLWDAQTGAQIGTPMKLDDDGILGSVGCAAFSPDGTHIATAGYDYSLGLWDAKTGARIGTPLQLDCEMASELGAESIEGTSLAFSPDGKMIAIGYQNGAIVRWSLRSRLPHEGAIQTSSEVLGVSFSGDGTRIFSVSAKGSVAVWDAVSGDKINEGSSRSDEPSSGVAFSSDRTRIALLGQYGLHLYWVESGVPLIDTPMVGHTTDNSARFRNHVAFSPDGARLASGGDDGTIRLWDVRTGVEIVAPMRAHEEQPGDGGQVLCVGISADGDEFISVERGKKLLRWDVQSGRLLGKIVLDQEPLFYHVAISPDRTRFASIADDGTVGIWGARTGSAIGVPRAMQDGSPHFVAFSPDGKRVASWADATHQLWDPLTGSPVGTPIKLTDLDLAAGGNPLYGYDHLAVSPDGRRVASAGADGVVHLWDPQTGQQIGAPLVGHVVGDYGGPLSMVFSHDQTRLASGDEFGVILLWDLATGCQIGRMTGNGGYVYGLAFLPDDTRIVSGHGDGTVRLWDVDYGSGNLFQILCRRLPTRDPPAILETYGISLDEAICSGEEPVPFPIKGTP